MFFTSRALMMMFDLCCRLRVSMEVHLDAFDPNKSITPAGIFSNRVDVVLYKILDFHNFHKFINFNI